jgi:microcystin-dependent protein
MDPFIGEIRLCGFNYAPSGWAFCNGQLLPISGYTALFSLLGTTFGGNGTSNFGLPDLRGCVPIHATNDFPPGASEGTESVTLTGNQVPSHTHALAGSADAATQPQPTGRVFAQVGDNALYAAPGNLTPFNALDVGSTGGGQPHNNCQPSLCLNFIIALQGVFPSHGLLQTLPTPRVLKGGPRG